MESIVIEPQYIGTCSFWKLITSNDVVFDVYEHYQKRSYRNRAEIVGANGKLRLSIPLMHGKNQHAAIKDVRISYNERWQELHWQSLVSCYSRSPYFEYYEDKIKLFYTQQYEFLADYNIAFIEAIAKLLKTEIQYSLSKEYQNKEHFKDNDWRNLLLPKNTTNVDFPAYPQVFNDRFAFVPDLCVLDVLFNCGNRSLSYINELTLTY